MIWNIPDDLKQGLKMSDEKGLQRLLRRVVNFFSRLHRPTFIGPISVDIGISLRQLQLLVDYLVSVGDLRKAISTELAEMGIDPKSSPEVYALTATGKTKVSRGQV